MAKGHCIFTLATGIARYADQIYGVLADEDWLLNTPPAQYIERLACYYDLTNKLHPFPEGNGRTQRLFIEHLAGRAGHEMDWSMVHDWEIAETAVQAFSGNREPIVCMLKRITKADRTA